MFGKIIRHVAERVMFTSSSADFPGLLRPSLQGPSLPSPSLPSPVSLSRVWLGRVLLGTVILSPLFGDAVVAADRAIEKPDVQVVDGEIEWVYDYQKGQALCKSTGKPMFLVFRCER